MSHNSNISLFGHNSASYNLYIFDKHYIDLILTYILTLNVFLLYFTGLKLRDCLMDNGKFTTFLQQNISMPPIVVEEIMDADLKLEQVLE